jgi:hypothetical protein
MSRKKQIRSLAQLTDCICPRCGRKHQLELYWTGKIPARKNCHLCRTNVRNFQRQAICPVSIYIDNRDIETFLFENED